MLLTAYPAVYPTAVYPTAVYPTVKRNLDLARLDLARLDLVTFPPAAVIHRGDPGSLFGTLTAAILLGTLPGWRGRAGL